MKTTVLVAFVIMLLVVFTWRDSPEVEPDANFDVSMLLSAGADGFQSVESPRAFDFPRDHGAHPDYRTEWWYWTGNLRDRTREFGFQLTFFRFALSPEPIDRPSAWASNQVFMAHFAVTDVAGKAFHSAERFSRGALGLAGADAEPFRVWLEDWSTEGLFPTTLRAATDSVELDLEVSAGKPMVLQGDEGFSQKSEVAASHYYSYTRLPASGRLRLSNEDFEVVGSVWFDREWSTSALSADQSGWDWFALQLNDNTELMYYRLRRHDGDSDPFSAGVFVSADSNTRTLGPGDTYIEPVRHWVSPTTGSRYPVEWQLTIPSLALSLTIAAKLDEQEHQTSFRYWEGSVSVEGKRGANTITGDGYVEMTGYDRAARSLRDSK